MESNSEKYASVLDQGVTAMAEKRIEVMKSYAEACLRVDKAKEEVSMATVNLSEAVSSRDEIDMVLADLEKTMKKLQQAVEGLRG